MKCYFCQETGHSRKDCPKFTTWLQEKKQGHEPSNTHLDEDSCVFGLEDEFAGEGELCQLVPVDIGVSVSVCAPCHALCAPMVKPTGEGLPLVTAPGARVTSLGSRRMRYDTEVGPMVTNSRIMKVGRPI